MYTQEIVCPQCKKMTIVNVADTKADTITPCQNKSCYTKIIIKTDDQGRVTHIGKDSGGCFIATACYGNYDAPDVMLLRQYRDQYLVDKILGRMFIKFYYAISPPIANFIVNRYWLKKTVRILLVTPAAKQAGNWLGK